MARQSFHSVTSWGMSPFLEGDQQFACWLQSYVQRLHCDCETFLVAFEEITKFFCSQYFEALTDLDGPALLNRIMREMDEKHGKN